MSEDRPERSPESLRHEYDQTLQNLRHYSNLRFAVFSIFIAVIGGVGFVAFGKGQFDDGAVKAARAAGFLVIVFFWLYEERTGQWLDIFRIVAVELERMLGYNRVQEGYKTGFYPLLPGATVLTRAFFFVVFVLWVYAFVAAS